MKTFNKRATAPSTTVTSTGVKFVMSTSTVDRVGDRVMPEWDLKAFKQNAIALFNHSHDAIIGTWKNVGVVAGELVGTLVLAKEGTSPLVDEVRSLIEQGILKAVSIGFSSNKVRANDFGGFDLYENALMECSIVAVPANQEALRKSLSKHLSSSEIDDLCTVNGCKLSGSTEEKSSVNAETNQPKQTTIKQGINMTYAERIAALQKSVSAKQATLDGLNGTTELTDEQMDEMGELTKSIASETDRIAKFEAMEKSTKGLVPAKKHVPQTVAKTFEDNAAVMGFIVKAALVNLESTITGISVDDAIAKRYGADNIVKSAQAFMSTKAGTPQDPAMTTVPEWAGALVQQGFGAFLDLIKVDSVLAQLPLAIYNFNGYNSIKIPKRAKRFPDDKNLAGAFVGEGAPIRVGAATLGSITLTPKKLAVIGTFTSEMFEQSTPNIESSIMRWMREDSSLKLDTVFLSAGAGTTVTPAGAYNGVTPIVSGGVTVDKLDIDLGKAIDQMEAAGAGVRPYWVMSKSRLRMLSRLRLATGDRAYPELAQGNLMGFPVASSTTVKSTEIGLIDTDSFAMSGGVPKFMASSQATLHEEYDETAVLPIVDSAGAAAAPVRSLYQTDSHAVRMIQPIDWSSLREGSVQLINAIA